jgi:hypothetical protein
MNVAIDSEKSVWRWREEEKRRRRRREEEEGCVENCGKEHVVEGTMIEYSGEVVKSTEKSIETYESTLLELELLVFNV